MYRYDSIDQQLIDERVAQYRDQIDRNADCYLVIFDRTPNGRAKSWEERLTWEELAAEGGNGLVTVVGG